MKITFASAPHPPVDLPDGADLSEHLSIQNSPVLFGCRTGICGTCLCEAVALGGGALPPLTAEETDLLDIIAPGNPKARLACQMRASGSVEIKYLGG